MSKALRCERHGSRPAERAGEFGEDRQVNVQTRALESSDAERQHRPLVLEPSPAARAPAISRLASCVPPSVGRNAYGVLAVSFRFFWKSTPWHASGADCERRNTSGRVTWVEPTGSGMLIPFRASTLKCPIGQSTLLLVSPPGASATAVMTSGPLLAGSAPRRSRHSFPLVRGGRRRPLPWRSSTAVAGRSSRIRGPSPR
jgi:hypothetical protein